MSTGKQYLNLTLLHFECFFRVVELGTMMKASTEMNISQPTLSQKIAQIEDAFNIKLFTRNKRQLEITEAGQHFLDRCMGIRDKFDELVNELEEHYSSDRSQSISIGFSDGQESSANRAVISKLQEIFSDFTLEIKIENRLHLSEKLLTGEINLCIIVDTERLSSNKNVSYKKIMKLPLTCLLHASSALAQKESITWEDINGYKCYWPISLKNTQLTKDLQQLFREKGIVIEWDYRDVDYFTLRRYLYGDKQMTLSLTQSVDDPSIKLFPLGGLSYPLIAAWRKTDTNIFEKYTDKLMSLTRNMLV